AASFPYVFSAARIIIPNNSNSLTLISRRFPQILPNLIDFLPFCIIILIVSYLSASSTDFGIPIESSMAVSFHQTAQIRKYAKSCSDSIEADKYSPILPLIFCLCFRNSSPSPSTIKGRYHPRVLYQYSSVLTSFHRRIYSASVRRVSSGGLCSTTEKLNHLSARLN
ncbi:hypothetical protein LINPERHAP2_LOCUS4759, partial [Linum perenne]